VGAARHVLNRKWRRSEHVVHQRAYRHVDSVRIPTVEKKQIEGRHGDQCNRRHTEHPVIVQPYRLKKGVCKSANWNDWLLRPPPLTPGVYGTPPNKMLENRTIVLSHSLPHWNETQTKCRQAGTSNGPNALTTALKGVGRPMIEPDASEAIGGSSVAFYFCPALPAAPFNRPKSLDFGMCVAASR
jgi:hypothetical protein